MPQTTNEYLLILPFLVLSAGIIVSLCVELFFRKGKELLPYLSIALFLIVAYLSVGQIYEKNVLFGGMLITGGIPAIFNLLFAAAGVLVMLNSIGFLKKYGFYHGEFYLLTQLSVLGMMLMAGSGDLVTVFLGLELMSIPFYVLVGMNRKKISANEAAMKYFLLGAFATGFIVYGIALIYGIMGNTSLIDLTENFYIYSENIIFITGFILILIGFSFKIAAFPFHMWVPDVYQGAATNVTGLMSTMGKSAAFSVIFILLTAVFMNDSGSKLGNYFAVIATLSMLYGSIVALSQNNLKRMLAYSSISHAGYMAIGLAAGNKAALAGIMFYLAAYTFMNLGAFGIISIIEGEEDKQTDLNSYAGLAKRFPFLAGMMALIMFALAGIPPMAGFFGKYYVFISAIQSNMTWLALVGILSSVISVYFYLRVVVYMYFKEPGEEISVKSDYSAYAAVIFAGILILSLGLFPDTFLSVIEYIISV